MLFGYWTSLPFWLRGMGFNYFELCDLALGFR